MAGRRLWRPAARVVRGEPPEPFARNAQRIDRSTESLMTDAATYFEDLMGLLPAVTPDTIVSRSVYSGDDARVTLFGFAPGQELTEHTAARPALLHFLRGRARLVLGGKAAEAGPGTWVRLPAHMPHSIFAEDEVVMLLTLLG